MKTLVLMACLLTFSYAIDPQMVKKVYDDLSSCFKELNVQQFTPEVIKCYLQKNDLLDEQFRLKKEECFVIMDNFFSDENVLNQAKNKVSSCMDQAYQDKDEAIRSNDEELMMFIECIMPLQNLLDLNKIVSQ